MKLRLLLYLLFCGCALTAVAQTVTVSGYLLDADTREPLVGASVFARPLNVGAVSNAQGFFSLALPAADSAFLEINYTAYQPLTLRLVPKNAALPLEILLPSAADLEEVVISTTRTNSRIEDLPVKVEVLGAEELNEEASLVPGGMGSLLGDLSVITIQRTGAVSGNDAVRMQGLAPGYTQLLQDGLPLYGGFSGSLGVLNIPPLDLRQVEIVKGSSSTLYGGGAIGGLINFLSKTPGATPHSTLLLNQTTLGETNANAFFSRKISATQGFTLLAAGTSKPARDVNDDGFAEIAQSRQVLVHPRWFWGLGRATKADLGATFSQNQLRGGDLTAIRAGAASSDHPFFQDETVRRLTVNGQISTPLSSSATWTLRGAGSAFRRGGQYAALDFSGQQLNTYLETNVWWSHTRTDLVLGANLTGERFELQRSTPQVAFGNFNHLTNGLFAQFDYRFSPKMALQAGFRADYHNQFGWLALPRLNLLFKPVPAFSARLGYGRGYKTPDLFSAVEPVDFTHLQPLAAAVRPDLANSLNADLNYQHLLAEVLSVQVNQAFYYVDLARPFETVTDPMGRVFVQNAAATGRVLGTDTYLQLGYQEWELYLGYNHTLSERRGTDGTRSKELFNPQDKIAATLAWSIPDRWRFGVETAYTGHQYVGEQRQVPTYWFWAAMVARQFRWGTVVLNCENVGDARQARHEALVTGGTQNPVFTPLWGPVEGRALNVSVKVDW